MYCCVLSLVNISGYPPQHDSNLQCCTVLDHVALVDIPVVCSASVPICWVGAEHVYPFLFAKVASVLSHASRL